MNGHDAAGIAAYGPQENDQECAWAEVGLRELYESYEAWLADPAAQAEYCAWLDTLDKTRTHT